MRPIWWVAAVCVCAPAYANDKPAIGPVPEWVRPTALPASGDKSGDQPLAILLSDQQIDFQHGRQTVYSETALKIQTAQGLAAGNISIPWRPDTDTLTVHKLVILRGDKRIDILGAGQTFTVLRRETNLDTATLDGVLTANIQPEGLQVGDIVDLALSISSSDPVMQGHVETIAGVWNGAPFGRAHLRAQWPSDMSMHLRQTASFPALKPVRKGGISSIEYSADNLKPIQPPKGAPARYQLVRAIEMSDFGGWNDVAGLLAPLYEKAAVIPSSGPLQQELERIRAASPDPWTRAEAALALVQDRVRYVALAMGTGGLVPADAEVTWSRRFGDCKAKTALLLGLLHALGIAAEPVAVNAISGDGIDARLPMVGMFNHVLVRATLGGHSYWLDGTRSGDTSLDRLAVPDFAWGLPIVPSGAALVRIVPPPLDKPESTVTIKIDARKGVSLPAPTHAEMLLRGDSAWASNQSLSAVPADMRDRVLREFWRKRYDFIDVTATGATFDPKTGEERLTMDGNAKMDWSSGYYQTDGTGVGYRADFTREPGPDSDAPFAVSYPFFDKVVENILLPPGFQVAKAGTSADVDKTVAGIEYKRRATLAGNAFMVETTERSVATEFPAKDAPAAQATLRELADNSVSIRQPANYRLTDAELAQLMATKLTTADALLARGNALLDRGRFDEAIKDFSAALAIDPKDFWALADRGIARVWKDDRAGAEQDLARAAAGDPHNVVVFRARGLMAERGGKPKDAVAAYTTALDIEPGNVFTLSRRAVAYRAAGDNQAALHDATAAIDSDPALVDLYLLRANIYRHMGKPDEALAQAAALTAANPDNAYAQTVAGSIYGSFGKQADALKAFDRAIAIKPEAYIYVSRAEHRPKEDRAGRLADIDAALKLDPKSDTALFAKATLLRDGGDYAAAIAAFDTILAEHPADVQALVQRGITYAKKGDQAAATRDLDAARAKADSAGALNNLCWITATAGVMLDTALRECDAALAKTPDDATILDSRAFVLMRMGRDDEAIATYTAALAKFPEQAASLMGRGLALAHKGEKAKAGADIAAAIKTNPSIKDQFEGYGFTIPQ